MRATAQIACQYEAGTVFAPVFEAPAVDITGLVEQAVAWLQDNTPSTGVLTFTIILRTEPDASA